MKKKIKTDYLIIGNSAAGIGAVQGIRKHDTRGSILLVSDEAHHTYSRPLISYWLEGRVEDGHLYYRDSGFYEDYGVNTKLGEEGAVLALDPDSKTAKLADGKTVSYEKLLLACGSSPFIPPIEGLETAPAAYPFTKLDDAIAVRKRLEELDHPARVVILGAGLIGLKAAEALADQSESITIVDLAPQILPSVLTPGTAPEMTDYLEDKGLVFKLGTSISRVEDERIILSDGEELQADLLILAAGTRPNVLLAKDAGIETGRGILTDATQKTNRDDIYAAGDCTDSFDLSSGQVKNMAILPNAFMQGVCAGENMAGAQALFEEAFPVNSLGLLGFHMLSAGAYTGEEIVESDEACTKHLFIQDQKLKGFIIFGDCPRAGILTDLIRRQTSLLEIDASRIFEHPGLMAFSEEARRDKLARAH